MSSTGSTMQPDFVSHCAELLSSVGVVRAKRMFGGHGIYIANARA